MSDKNLQSYMDYFEQLSMDNLDQLDRVMTEDVHFVDPFNDVQGLESVRKIFVHMFIIQRCYFSCFCLESR